MNTNYRPVSAGATTITAASNPQFPSEDAPIRDVPKIYRLHLGFVAPATGASQRQPTVRRPS